MSAPNKEIHPSVRRFIDAFNDQDVDALMAEFADGGTLLDPFLDEEITGAELREYNAQAFEAFPDVHLEVERSLTGSDGTTMIEWTLSATHKGEFEGLPPTGNAFTLSGSSIATASDDGITYWRDYYDQQTLAEQLGLTFPSIIIYLPTIAWGKIRSILGPS